MYYCMLAVIETGGKQYIVKKGDHIQVEKILMDEGKTLDLESVLLVTDGKSASTKVGTPFVKGATVSAKVVASGKGKKVRVYKMKQRKRYRRNKGHRQMYTELEITGIKG
jgi:large subunit ribosomal protein L21